jgi:hypothetical protein
MSLLLKALFFRAQDKAGGEFLPNSPPFLLSGPTPLSTCNGSKGRDVLKVTAVTEGTFLKHWLTRSAHAVLDKRGLGSDQMIRKPFDEIAAVVIVVENKALFDAAHNDVLQEIGDIKAS